MLDKIVPSLEHAFKDLRDGAVVMVHGFGPSSVPTDLIDGLLDHTDVRDMTMIANNAGTGYTGMARMIASGRVRKVVCSYPRSYPKVPSAFEDLYAMGKFELELVPQGTLSERIRAGGAGIGAFFTPTGAGTPLAEGKEVRVIDGRQQVMEYALKADVALISAYQADRWGNLTYRLAARNFGPIMAMAANITIVQARAIVELGDIPAEHVMTPSIFVSRIVHIPNPKPGS